MPSITGLTPLDQSPEMKKALQAHIIRQRQKKKEEAEMSAALHQERREREEKQQRDSATLEDTNKQIADLKARMTELQREKHDLFAQLKKLINQEEENRKRKEKLKLEHEREKMEILSKVGPAPALANVVGSPQMGCSSSGGPAPPPPPPKKLNQLTSSPPHANIPVIPGKRPRSPSPNRGGGQQSSPYSYSSPKQLTSPYRSPYQQQPPYLGPSPAKIPAVQGGGYAPSGPQQVPTGAFPASTGATLPPPPPPPRLTGQQMSPGGIPILPPQKQVGGITSGFPVHKTGGLQSPQAKAPMYGHSMSSRHPYGQGGSGGMLR